MTHAANINGGIIDDAALQRYYDGESSPAESRDVASALMRDAALRARLESLRRADDAARAILLINSDSDVRGGMTAAVRVAAAAALLTIVGASTVWLVIFTTSDTPELIAEANAEQHNLIPLQSYAAGSVVLSIPGATRAASNRAETPAPEESAIFTEAASGSLIASRVEAMLAAGRVDAAIMELAAGPVAAHSETWTRVGEHMRSTELARESLLMLPAAKQLEIVRVWSNEPMLRPVVFQRLEELHRDPDTADAARALRDDLAKNPALRSWLSSYAAR